MKSVRPMAIARIEPASVMYRGIDTCYAPYTNCHHVKGDLYERIFDILFFLILNPYNPIRNMLRKFTVKHCSVRSSVDILNCA